MARKIKIDNAVLKRFAREDQKRKVGGIPQREYYLIVCEGEKTEPNYFKSLKEKLPIGVVDYLEIEGEGKNTLNLIEETNKIRERKEKGMNGRKFDHTWAVFDRDSFPETNFDNAINKGEQQRRKINCAWSNEAFELWYLLHLEFVNVPMTREDYKPRIEHWLTERIGLPFKYAKNRADMYDILQKYGNEEQAIEWAKLLDNQYVDFRFSTHNPNTKLYILVGQLNKLKQQ
jgi:RloB-like protein